MRINNAIIYLIMVLFAFKAKGQHYAFKNFSTEEGLAQSQVNTICQDKDNFLWVGTLGGVSRYNGREFASFYKEDGLPSNNVLRLVCDGDNSLWGVTRKGVFTIQNSKIKTLETEINVINNNTKDLAVSSEFLFVATSREGVYKFAKQKDSGLLLIKQIKLPVEGVAVNRVSIISNKVYLGTSAGLFFLEDEEAKRDTRIPEVNCTGITTDFKGNMWVSTFKSGIFKFPINGSSIVNFTEKNSDIASDYVRDLFIDFQGSVWFSSKRSVTKICDQGQITNFSESNGFNYVAETVFQDSEGNIWVGTEGKGIVKFISEEFKFLTTKQGLHSDLMTSFCEDEQGNIWFSSYGDGVAKRSNGVIEQFTSYNSKLANNTIWCSLKDSKQNLWFGTADGLSLYKNEKFTTFYEQDGLPSKKVQSLYQDENDTLWIGTKYGVVKFIDDEFLDDQTISLRNVRGILKDQNNVMWFATSRGLFYSSGIKKPLRFYNPLLEGKTIYAIAAFRNTLWVGTSSGLFVITDGEVTEIDLTEKNRSGTVINFVKTDSDNVLWIGTNNGVYTSDLVTFIEGKLKIKRYKKDEGLVGVETNLSAIFEDSKKNIWIGTSEGVAIYKKSKKDNRKDFVPQVKITKIKLFYEDKNWVESTDNELSFAFNRNHFTFYYNTPYFHSEEGVKYSFILDGFDEDWSPMENSEFARYANIPHGNYTFKVKSTVDGLVWSHTKRFSFVIERPFWLTWWFRALLILGVFLIAAIIFKRQKNIIKEKQARELLVYKNKLIKLEQQTLNASLNRHFIFNALNSIQFYINKEDKLSANRYLSSFAKLIRKNLDSSSNESNLLPLREEIERLTLYLSLEKMRFKGKFDYNIHIDEDINQEEIKVPGMFLQPFVENSIWHGVLPSEKIGEIDLIITKEEGRIHFIVQDNGIGISTSIKNKEGELKSHASKGMAITTNRIALLEKIIGKDIILHGPKDIVEEGEIKGTIVEIVFH